MAKSKKLLPQEVLPPAHQDPFSTPQKKQGYKFFERHLIKRSSNIAVEGFNFTKDDFENLIDNFTPPDDIHILLGTNEEGLDIFCLTIYGLRFEDAYHALLKQAQYYVRSSIMFLARMGNNTALKQQSEITGIGKEQQDQQISISFIDNVPSDTPSDVDIISDSSSDFSDI